MFNGKKILIVILATGIGLRLCYLWQFSASPLFCNPIGPDVQEYDEWARSILAGNLLWQSLPIHGPVYPYFLAALYKVFSYDFFLVRFFQLLVGMSGLYLLFLTSRRFGCYRHSGLPYLVLGIAVLYTPLIYYQGELICESILLPLLTMAIYFLYLGSEKNRISQNNFTLQNRYFALAGVATGFAVITHPISLLFVIMEFACVALFWRQRQRCGWKKAIPAAIFILSVAVVVAPVCVYNSALAGKFVLVQKNSGLNLYIGNNANATGGCYVRPGPAWIRLNNLSDSDQEVHNESAFVSRVIDYISNNPGKWLALSARKAVYVWNWRDLIAGADSTPLRNYTTIMQFSRWLSGIIFTLGFAGLLLVLCKKQNCYKYRHFLLLLAAFWLAQVLTVTSGRYRLAMLPAIFIFAAFFIQDVRSRWRTNRVLLVGVFVIAVALVWFPCPPVNSVMEDAEANSLTGEAFYRQGEFLPAEHHLTAALPRLEDKARCLNLLGILSEKRLNIEAASQFYHAAITADQTSPEGYMNLAVMALSQNKITEAGKLFNEALLRGKNNADVLYNVAYYMERQGYLQLAEQYYLQCLKVSPAYSRALNALGVMAMGKKDYKHAITLFRQALATSPANSGIMLNLAAATASDGDTENASKIIDRILKKEPEHRNALLMKRMLTVPADKR